MAVNIYRLKPGDIVEIKGITFKGKTEVVEFVEYCESNKDYIIKGFIVAKRKEAWVNTIYTLQEVLNTPASKVLYGG